MRGVGNRDKVSEEAEGDSAHAHITQPKRQGTKVKVSMKDVFVQSGFNLLY